LLSVYFYIRIENKQEQRGGRAGRRGSHNKVEGEGKQRGLGEEDEGQNQGQAVRVVCQFAGHQGRVSLGLGQK
jgi:hypothetical protein